MKWAQKVDVSDLWAKADAGELTAAQLGKDLAQRLRDKKLPLGNLLTQFEGLADDATFDDFDVPLKRLYDWADWHQRLWVKTF